MEARKYFEILKDIRTLEKEYGLDLSTELVIAIMQEVGKDMRTGKIDESKKENIREMKKEANPNIPTEKQIAFLKKSKVKISDNLTKQEATRIIKEIIEKMKENGN